MKVLSVLLPLIAATSVAARSVYDEAQNALADKPTVPGKNPLDFCGPTDDYILEVDFVDLYPNPPKPGETLQIIANGTLLKDIEEGATVFLQVKYGLITLIKQEADLCENLKEVDLSCPLKKGPMAIVKEVQIPAQVPPGKYTVHADVKTVDKEPITCMESIISFTRG